MRKTAVEAHYSCIRQKTAPKNSQYSKNGIILKIGKNGHPCKAYDLCKVVSLGQKLKMPKTCDKRLYKHIRLVLCKKRLQKAANI